MTHRMRMRTLLMWETYFKWRPILLMETDRPQDEAPRFPKTFATVVDLFHLLDLNVLFMEWMQLGFLLLTQLNVEWHLSFVICQGSFFLMTISVINLIHLEKQLTVRWRRRIFKRQLRCYPKFGRKHWLMGTRWIVELPLLTIYVYQELVTLCGWQNIVNNLGIVYKLWNAKINPNARLLRQIGSRSSLIVSYRFLPSTNTQTIATHQSNPQDIFCPTTFAPLTHRLLVKVIPEEGFHYHVVPFDLYCPFMKENLNNGVCKTCGKYWSREAVTKRHKKSHKKKIEAKCGEWRR